VRMNFLRGIITGGILGAAVSILMGPEKKPEKRGLVGRTRPRRDNRSQVKGVLRSVGKTVNEVGKTVNDYIKK